MYSFSNKIRPHARLIRKYIYNIIIFKKTPAVQIVFFHNNVYSKSFASLLYRMTIRSNDSNYI